jgi:hypothetical protein
MAQKFRYQGYRSFTKETKNLFFGRAEDTRRVVEKIDTHSLTILFGRSGDGKSSLINAGIIPALEDSYIIIPVRFYPFQSNKISNDPAKRLKEVLKDSLEQSKLFLEELNHPRDKASAWQYIKSLQLKSFNKQLIAAELRKIVQEATEEEIIREKGPEEEEIIKPKGILLVMDQFEEVFTYLPDHIQQFGQDLSEVLYNRMPSAFQSILYQSLAEAKSLDQDLKKQLALIEMDTQVKVLIGIRWDKKGHLHKLKSAINFIEQNEYELKPLTIEQATEAIIKPAGLEGIEFRSPRIEYDRQALQDILDFLSKKNSTPIEAFQLQIICRYIEKVIVTQGSKDWEGAEKSIFTVATYHGINQAMFEDVLKTYYQKFINSKKRDQYNKKQDEQRFSEFEKIAIRQLIERKLIDDKSKSRKPPVGDTELPAFGIDPNYHDDDENENVISSLIGSRLVREEPNSRGGNSYELCHDTMVVPILNQAQQLGDLTQTISNYYYSQLKSSPIPTKKLKNFINNHFLDKAKDLERVNRYDLLEEEYPYLQELEYLKIIRRIEPVESNGPNEFELYKQFQNPAILSQSAMLRTFNKKNLVASVVVIAMLVLILGLSISNNKKANREINQNLGEKIIANAIDTLSDKIIALQLLDSIYRRLDTSIKPAVFKEVIKIFKERHFEATDIVLRDYEISAYEVSGDGKWILVRGTPSHKASDIMFAGLNFSSGAPTYFLYGRDGQLKDSLTINKLFGFLGDNEHIYSMSYSKNRVNHSSLSNPVVDTINVYSLNNLHSNPKRIPIEDPYEIHADDNSGVHIFNKKRDLGVRINYLESPQSLMPRPGYKFFTTYISANGQNVVYIRDFPFRFYNPFDIEFWSVDKMKRESIVVKQGQKILTCVRYKNSDKFYVTSYHEQNRDGDKLTSYSTKTITIFDGKGKVLKSFNLENSRVVSSEILSTKSGIKDYYLFIIADDYSAINEMGNYYLYAYEAGKEEPLVKIPLGNTNSLQSTTIGAFCNNSKTVCIPVNKRKYNDFQNGEITQRKAETSVSADSRLYILNPAIKGFIDSISFDFAINGVQLSTSGDSIILGKVDRQERSVILIDRNKKEAINEFSTYTELEECQPLSLQSIYTNRLPLSKDGSLLVLRDAKEKLVVYDIRKPLVNSNNAEEILNWVRKAAIPPLPDSTAKKYLKFKPLISFWPF